MFQKGFKTLGCAIVPILIFSQTAMAAPLSIIYQTKDNQTVQADYVNALANPPMKAALTSALLTEEVANLPIFITDDNGSVINYTAALSRNEDYATALKDSAVNQATAPVATQQMNADGSVTPLAPSAPFTYSSTEEFLGNTIVNVTVNAQNVTGVTVKGTAAIQVGASNIWRAGLAGAVIVSSSDITLVTGNNPPNNGLDSVKMMPSSVNSVLGGSQAVTVVAQDTYGNPIANQTIYLQTGIQGLWLTQVNGTMITGSVNMGTSSVPSMQTLNTPVPLFNLGTGTGVPAYQSASVQGLTAYHLNDNIAPVVALITGVDGTVSFTLVDGNVTYVANTATTSGTTNSYIVDSGAPINQQALSCFADSGQTQKLGSILLNWVGGTVGTIGSLGVASDLSGFNTYNPLLTGAAAPASILTVTGVTTPSGNKYDSTLNASFVTAPFNSYPAIGTISSQGLTLTLSSDKNGVISNVDGYTLVSNPAKATVDLNSLGEVSVNQVKLWTAQSGYQVVGYLSGANGSVTLLEESTTTPGNFAAYSVSSVGATPVLADSWTGLAASSLAGSFEGYLGFSVDAGHNLIPQAASKYKNGWSKPAQTAGKSLAGVEFTPVVVTKVYVSDKNPETPTITITNSLDSQTATVSANFKAAASSGSTFVRATPSSVKSAMGGSQKITFTAQDAYGTPIANRTIYLGTGMPGLWISKVNGTFITGSVNIGTSSSIAMQTVNTPVPLFSVSKALAYTNASVTGLTAYNLDKANPVVALVTGSDGTVSITLVDGNVTYVANTATENTANSYAVDVGTPLNKTLTVFADSAGTQKLGSVQVNWN